MLCKLNAIRMENDMKKRNIILCFVMIVMLVALTACGNTMPDGDKPSIVCTNFPEYDWTRNILGDRIDEFTLTLLLDDGTDMHSYQPTAEDIAAISVCDVFVYVGGESDEWVEDIPDRAKNKDMRVVNLLSVLGDMAKEEEIVEGMEAEEDEGDEETGENDSPELDEHVWLSLKNAELFVDQICDEIELLDKENATIYEENANSYIAKLQALDEEYKKTLETAAEPTLIFADRFPFRYMVEDYGIPYYAAFAGCSAETEASFETITFLANKVDELGRDNIIVIEGSDDRLAKAVIQNTKDENKNIVTLDSLQSVTKAMIDSGSTYLGIMEENLEILRVIWEE